MGLSTRVLRPLEQTIAEWNTTENLDIYFHVAIDVLLDAGVVVMNPAYDPSAPYSEDIIITRPERVCSYDETRVELNCTKGGTGKRDRAIRIPFDDGETVVTMSERCASAACGRLSNGRALPVYIVFGSGETYDPEWASDIKTPDILDKDGKPFAWRYTCNTKGSVNAEFCPDYVENIFRPALGYPLPRDTHPGE